MKAAHKFLALLLAAALITLSLAGCGDKKNKVDLSDPEKLLTDAMSATQADISERYDASPLAAIAGTLTGNAMTAEFGLSGAGAEITGTLLTDTATQQVSLALGVRSADESLSLGLDAGVYYSPEFVGISLPFLFGDDTYYGLRPSGIAEQLEGSVFADLFELDMDSIKALDDLLSSASDATFSPEEVMKKLEALNTSFSDSLELEAKQETVDFRGSSVDGIVITATADADTTADLVEGIYDIVFTDMLGSVTSLMDESELSEMTAGMDEVVQDIRSGGIQTDLRYELADGHIARCLTTLHGEAESATIAFEFYDDITVTVTDSDGSVVTLVSHVDNSDGYAHTLTFDLGEEGRSSISFDWKKDGAFALNVNDGGETASVTGTLKVEGGSVDLTGAIDYMGDTAGLSLKLTDSANITVPSKSLNLGDMTEEEIYSMLMLISMYLDV